MKTQTWPGGGRGRRAVMCGTGGGVRRDAGPRGTRKKLIETEPLVVAMLSV